VRRQGVELIEECLGGLAERIRHAYGTCNALHTG